MTTYRVKGLAFVPVECFLNVDARTAEAAMNKAKKLFKSDGEIRRNSPDQHSADFAAIFGFEPTDANESE